MKKIHFLIILLGLSLFMVMWIDFEIIPHIRTTANFVKLNNILETIFLAYITSFIFYFIVVYLRENKDRKNTRDYVTRKINEISNTVNEFIEELKKIDGVDFESKYPTKKELQEKFKSLDLSSKIKSNRVYPISYEEYFKEHAKDIQNRIDRILILLPYLNSRFVDKMNQVYDCQFIYLSIRVAKSKDIKIFAEAELTKITKTPFSGFNLATLYPDHIEDYFKLISNLKKHCP